MGNHTLSMENQPLIDIENWSCSIVFNERPDNDRKTDNTNTVLT